MLGLTVRLFQATVRVLIEIAGEWHEDCVKERILGCGDKLVATT
jgi:hypothetical protein